MASPPVVQAGLFNSTNEAPQAQSKEANETEFNLPKTSKDGRTDSSQTAENIRVSQEKLKEKEKQGFKIPAFLKKIWDYTNKGADIIVMAIGVPLKYAGLIFLIVGAIHFIVILFTAAPPLVMAGGGMMAVILILIKSGALPTIIAGATLYKFGSDLIKNESFPSLNLIPWVLPLPFYQWLSMTKPPSPMDMN